MYNIYYFLNICDKKKSRLKLRNSKCQYGFSALSFHAIVVGSCKVKFVFFSLFEQYFFIMKTVKKYFFPTVFYFQNSTTMMIHLPNTKHQLEKNATLLANAPNQALSLTPISKKNPSVRMLSPTQQEFHATRPSMSLVVVVVRDGRSLAKGKCCGLPIPFLPSPPTTMTTTMTNYESIRL